jgi:hypothetical protein
MTISQSCVMAIPTARRALMGLADPEKPQLLVDFKFMPNGSRVDILRSSLVGQSLLSSWLGNVPLDLRKATAHLVYQIRCHDIVHVKMYPTQPGHRISEHERELSRQVAGIIGDDLLTFRRKLVRAIEALPTQQELEERLKSFMRLRLKFLVMTTPEALRAPNWLTYSVAPFPGYETASVLDLMRYVQNREHEPKLREYELRSGRRLLRVPFLTRRHEDEDVQDMVVLLQTQSAKALLEGLIPELYRELVPEEYHSPDPPSVNDYETLGVDLAISRRTGEA